MMQWLRQRLALRRSPLERMWDALKHSLQMQHESAWSHDGPWQHGLETQLNHQSIHLSVTQFHARRGSSSEHLMRDGSMPYATLTLRVCHIAPPSHTCFTLQSPRATPRTRPLFGDTFDAQIECHGSIDDLLATLNSSLRSHLEHATCTSSTMSFEAHTLTATLPLYHHTQASTSCAWLQLWLTAHQLLTHDTKQSRHHHLLDTLLTEQDAAVARTVLTTILRQHEQDLVLEQATLWALNHPEPHTHITLGTLSPALITPTGPLTDLLVAHAIRPALETQVRTACLKLLGRHALDAPRVRHMFLNLSLQAQDLNVRGYALTCSLRMREQPKGQRTALILSARHLVRRGELKDDLRKRMKSQLKHMHASVDAQTHHLLARQHIEHSMRYTSLSTLAHDNLQEPKTFRTFLHSAIFDQDTLPRDFALRTLMTTPSWTEAITRHHLSSDTDPLERLLCAHILSKPFALTPSKPKRVALGAQLILSLKTLSTPSSSAYATHTLKTAFFKLFDAHPNIMSVCCTRAHNISSARLWLTELIPKNGSLILEGIKHQAGTYTGRAQVDAQDLLFALLHHAPASTHDLALDLLTPLVSLHTMEKLRALRIVWSNRSTPQVEYAQCLARLDRLIRDITRSIASAPGALSLNHTHHTTGALSPSYAHGTLSLADQP